MRSASGIAQHRSAADHASDPTWSAADDGQEWLPVETLLTFSGHTNVNTLKRYLNFWRILSVEEAGAQAAARFLAQTPGH